MIAYVLVHKLNIQKHMDTQTPNNVVLLYRIVIYISSRMSEAARILSYSIVSYIIVSYPILSYHTILYHRTTALGIAYKL